MIIFLPIILVYGIAIGVAGWFVLHAEKKRQLLEHISGFLSRVTLRVDNGLSSVSSNTNRIHSGIRRAGSLIWQAGVQYRKALLISLIILITPIIVAVLIKPNRALEGYADVPQTTDPVITALLQGEQLVPPAPLPPELFVTQEVEAVRQDLSGASREWAMLDTDFRQRLLTVFQLMAKCGYQMALIEGYRSPERQNYLAGLGPQVTNVGAYQSYHQYGLAADCAFLRDGKIIISEKDPWAMNGYRLYGEYAELVGLIWGGRWKLMDFGHIELRKAQMLGKH
jgi:peptidoglycan L-alanyl-D-glutamate endopeptidase CwlK